jgi:hypothetical protein
MTIMLGKVYAALKAAGAPEEEAMAAAEEMGNLHDQFGGLRTATHDMHVDMKGELSGLRNDFRTELGELRVDLRIGLSGLRDEFRSELGELRNDFRTESGKLREDFRAELSASRVEHRGESASLRDEIAYLRGRFDLLIWAVGINAATTIAILGVLLRH